MGVMVILCLLSNADADAAATPRQEKAAKAVVSLRARLVDEIDIDRPGNRGFVIYLGKQRLTDYEFVNAVSRVSGEPVAPEIKRMFEPEFEQNKVVALTTISVGAFSTLLGAGMMAFGNAGVIFAGLFVAIGGVALMTGGVAYAAFSNTAVAPDLRYLDRRSAEALVWRYNSLLRDKLWTPPPPEPPPPPVERRYDDFVRAPVGLTVAFRY